MKLFHFFYFYGSFFSSGIRIPNTDPYPDPLIWLNPDPIRIQIPIRNPDKNAPNGFNASVLSPGPEIYSTVYVIIRMQRL